MQKYDPMSQQYTTFDYDVFGNLRGVELADGRAVQYDVDALNRRIGRRVDGAVTHRWLYKDQLNPVAELDAANNVVALFVYGSRRHVPEFMIRGGTTYRFVTDHLGSVRLVVDAATGAVAQRIDYDEFGNVLLDTNPGFQPFGFAGGLYDADTGLVRFGARDYDPVVGRWTAKDPSLFAGSDTDLYRYAFGDPINLADVNGEDVCVHRSSEGYHHRWVSFNNDPERSYGAWPSGDPFSSRQDIENPDIRADEIGDPGTDTVCYESSEWEDDWLEDYIRHSYNMDDPSTNPPYIFGVNDCRHFVDDVLDQLDRLQGRPWWQFWR